MNISLLTRTQNAHRARTEKGAVADCLPLSAVYALLAMREHGSISGIRIEDREGFRALFDSDRDLEQDMRRGETIMSDNNLFTAGTIHGPSASTGYIELTPDGKRWANRLYRLGCNCDRDGVIRGTDTDGDHPCQEHWVRPSLDNS